MNREKFRCAYCGKEHDSPIDRAKCEMSCGAKESEKQFKSRVDEVKMYYTQAGDMRKYADKMKLELIADYPQKRGEIENGLECSDVYFLVAGDKNIDDFKKQFSDSLNSVLGDIRLFD